jgi:hypothetical protein
MPLAPRISAIALQVLEVVGVAMHHIYLSHPERNDASARRQFGTPR